jgi:hypothetical protein
MYIGRKDRTGQAEQEDRQNRRTGRTGGQAEQDSKNRTGGFEFLIIGTI